MREGGEKNTCRGIAHLYKRYYEANESSVAFVFGTAEADSNQGWSSLLVGAN